MQKGLALNEFIKEELIDSRVEVHDSTHFELKLDYSIDSKRKLNRYRVESYFFVPRSLGINRNTYPREQFYNDVQSYIRFKTPNIPLSTIADAADPLSPLHQIMALVTRLTRAPGNAELEGEIGHELRLFGCVIRAQLRDVARGLRRQMEELERTAEAHQVLYRDLEKRCASFLDAIGSVLSAWRDLRADLLGPHVSRALRETYEFVDEYVSLIVENKFTSLIGSIDASPRAQASLGALRERARQLLIQERSYRSGVGYQSVLEEDDENDNEHYVYRRGMLKKFIMSPLWLEISKEKEGGGVAHVGAAIAAGAAMAFALLATVHGGWMVSNTAGFVVAGTLIYILKDRIKEWLRVYLSSRLAAWLPDYSVKIRYPGSRGELGRCKESFGYMAPAEVPRPVYDLRHQGEKASIEVQAKPEVVLRYQKHVWLKGHAIVERLHLEDYDVNDIIRFGLRHFLVRTDDPQASVATYDPHRDRVERRRFPKVYHLNVVMVLRAASSPDRPQMRRIRVVFDKSGIRRIENVA